MLLCHLWKCFHFWTGLSWCQFAPNLEDSYVIVDPRVDPRVFVGSLPVLRLPPTVHKAGVELEV